MELQPKKLPSPWLAPVLALVGLIITGLWDYLQMRHWKQPDADYVWIATSLIVTLLLWVVLLVVIFLYIARRRMLSSIRDAMEQAMVSVIEKRSHERTRQEDEHTEEQSPRSVHSSLPSPPVTFEVRNPDLRGEILESVFGTKRNGVVFPLHYVLVNTSVTNHGSKPTVIKKWSLRMSIGDHSYYGDQIRLRLRRDDIPHCVVWVIRVFAELDRRNSRA